ncbi:cobaltochelatase subunit CobN [Haloglycomyces albus]|uniref:cobaltochelatase subunit CobN n=1 Tax=Haloglycomyces albus TaxID=526067 RepID=UPI00046CCA4C|nr:cobaltochelatase subunit CobN [Haloglycomyces albus]
MTDTILFLTTADTEILAAAQAVERLDDETVAVRALNPARAPKDDSEAVGAWIDDNLADVRVAVVRLLGGRAAFPELFDQLRHKCGQRDIALVALSGESSPDAELTAASTLPTASVAQCFEYLRLGGVDNTEQLFRFVADTVMLHGCGFSDPQETPGVGTYHPHRGDALSDLDPDRPTIGVVFYRSHLLSGNTEFIDALLESVERKGANAVGLFCYSLRENADGAIEVLSLAEQAGVTLDGLVVTVLAAGGAHGREAGALTEQSWRPGALDSLGIPIVQALTATSSRADWEASDIGMSPLDTAMQIAMPEFDGRIVSVPFSFKETTGVDERIGGPLVRYVPDHERCLRVAGIAMRYARLSRLANSDKRIAIVMSNYPTKHSRIGNGVGLDTPASTTALLRTMRELGYRLGDDPKLETWLEDSDALIAEMIARGGFDSEQLSDQQLAHAEAHVPVSDYRDWFSQLPQALQEAVEDKWGPAPGDILLSPDGKSLVTSTLGLGNVVLAIQPPRGFGDNPVAIYHDPDLPPTHQYLAAYWWIERIFQADAIVHIGKHGTLEWLPGKGVGLSAECATDATLTDVPLFYPFVVNDPGEGTQAKRRGHATIIDHLVPPMMRAETYDDVARLEQLLDEYAELELLDPSKLPSLRSQIWELLVSSHIAEDLGAAEMPDDPDDFGDMITHVDGYLCEIKDMQVRDGLHVFGSVPASDQLQGLLKAVLRLPQGDTPGLRSQVAAHFGIDERVLSTDPGQTVDAGVALPGRQAEIDRLLELQPGPGARRSDLLDAVDAVSDRLVVRLAESEWRAESAEDITTSVLRRSDDEVADVLRFACREAIPRIQACSGEIDRLVSGLDGRYIRSGPSGSPTRGRLDVLPTGKNFYSVDPKGLPSSLAWEVGQRLADALINEYREAHDGAYPESVGIVVWGTANMRTHGDDIAEILALLGVRPVWHPETRRVVDLEVIDLEELGRPRVDVTVRISGFFRDAFPHLVALIDRAVRMVAERDDEGAANHVAAHSSADRDRLVEEGHELAWAERHATARVFGAKPGAYGAGLLPLIEARNWRDSADIAEVYTVWSGHAYGDGLDGVEAHEDFHRNLGRVKVAVKNTDTREHDILDSDDYFQEHGGMIATIRHLTGQDVHAVIGDSSDPSRPQARTLSEEVNRVFRARVANPKWIESMQRHGYKGAFEMAATVDYMFGYDATASVVSDWQYERVAETYVFDDHNRKFMEQSNPWALHGVTERLLEAQQRGLWKEPDEEVVQRLQQFYIDAEGLIEERGEDNDSERS